MAFFERRFVTQMNEERRRIPCQKLKWQHLKPCRSSPEWAHAPAQNSILHHEDCPASSLNPRKKWEILKSFEILGGVIGWRSKTPQQRGLVFWPRLNFILATNGALTCFEF